MKFVVIFGPQAVGKMTVGQELEKLTGLKLFHNHMTIELVVSVFGHHSKEAIRLSNQFREEIFKSFAKSRNKGMIFTFLWAFNLKDEKKYIDKICRIFEKKGGEIFFVELEADAKERLRRNKTPKRLKHKPTKRDLKWSEGDLKETMKKHRLNSKPGEIKRKNYIRIDNTKLSSKEVARMIKKGFGL